MKEAALKNMAEYITQCIYRDFASSSGYLFGLEPDARSVVKIIVYQTLRYLYEQEEEGP